MTVHPSAGVARLAIAWKVAAFMPLVLTGAVLAGRIDFGGDDPGTSPSANISVIDDRTPEAIVDDEPRDDEKDGEDDKGDKGDKEKSDEPSPADSPTADPTSASPTATPTTDDPSPDKPDPTKSPTKSPTKNPSPSPTDPPTPDEAREACEEAGVNPLDLAAMAACIADIVDGG